MWQMDDLRTTAITSISQLSSDDSSSALKLRIACDHLIHEWKYPIISSLVLREHTLSSAETDILRSGMAAAIMQIRELDIFDPEQTFKARVQTKTTTTTDHEIFKHFGCRSPFLATQVMADFNTHRWHGQVNTYDHILAYTCILRIRVVCIHRPQTNATKPVDTL
jgi:hypothetical protein